MKWALHHSFFFPKSPTLSNKSGNHALEFQRPNFVIRTAAHVTDTSLRCFEWGTLTRNPILFDTAEQMLPSDSCSAVINAFLKFLSCMNVPHLKFVK